MFLIKKLWIDTSENRNAMGFKEIGVVGTKEEADRICAMENVQKSAYPWPLNYSHYQGFTGDSVPRFVAMRLSDLTGMSHEQLKAL